MAAETKRKNLGRGLSALLGEKGEDYSALDRLRVSKMVPVELLHPGKYQPRRIMDEESLNELAKSISEKGVLQPLLVRRRQGDADSFEIIAGERRWRAAQKAKAHEVPVIIKDLNDREALEVALVENLQRQDLSPLEEAEGYNRLLEEFKHTQENLAKSVGKSRSHVANMMRLLGLPGSVKAMMERGELTAGHARALLNVKDPEAVARQVVERGLNVRQTELLAKDNGRTETTAKKPAAKDVDAIALENDLTNLLGLMVKIKFRGEKGSLAIHYNSLDQLDDILHRLSHGAHGARRENADESES
ncbi:MAG: chromosome partitioning protein ParB [Rhodospirillales bacterium RIFCSPLOWO2_12_FULL_58_28]|nr:MAG: chromosome partitioning protein ParB [Rhodospirillales bacterium RIFCSPLOWO2_02_FULL_58_16]OHC77386.1 MAG: chromosome partitioning protein ParB [Rhodospirillales bacterium RIFCSPLOWO2_12_FULL_58_28]